MDNKTRKVKLIEATPFDGEIKAGQESSLSSFLSAMAIQQGIEPVGSWFVMLTVKEGTLPAKLEFMAFSTEKAAREWTENAKENLQAFHYKPSKSFEHNDLSHEEKNNLLACAARIGTHLITADECLDTFGIMSFHGVLSQKVTDFLGNERIENLKEIFGDNWKEAAALEYSLRNFPFSSAVVIAARQKYAEYVEKNAYAAGYLMRDLQVIFDGSEEAIEKAIKQSGYIKANAAKGGDARKELAERRKQKCFKIAKQNPDWVLAKNSAKALRRIVSEKDEEDLFRHKNKPLSESWFENLISEWRQTGKINSFISIH